MTKTNVALAALLVGLPVLFFFQNCAQSGSLTASTAALNATSDSLIVDIPAHDIQLDRPALDDNGSSTEKESIAHCEQVVISDILLKVSSINAFEITEADKTISLEKLTLKLKALKSEKIHDVTLLLSDSGNKVLTTQNVVIELKTPSGQLSGVKAQLSSDYDVVAGRNYELVLSVRPNEQIVTNKNKCLFKPVIHSAVLNNL